MCITLIEGNLTAANRSSNKLYRFSLAAIALIHLINVLRSWLVGFLTSNFLFLQMFLSLSFASVRFLFSHYEKPLIANRVCFISINGFSSKLIFSMTLAFVVSKEYYQIYEF